ncbi:hypothetical protein B0G73_108261 [Paraburkholderia sp. BL25I1N1]|nr:hypothetical protein B0G73_108261 [Paraburkholderia sp. BL25I1N1]
MSTESRGACGIEADNADPKLWVAPEVTQKHVAQMLAEVGANSSPQDKECEGEGSSRDRTFCTIEIYETGRRCSTEGGKFICPVQSK